MRRKYKREFLLAIIAALMGCLSATAQNIPPGLTCVQATYPRNSVAVGGATGYCVPPAQAGIGSYSTCYTGANSNSTTVDVCASSCIAEPTTVNATLQDGYDPSAPLITVPINVTPPALSLNIPGTVFGGTNESWFGCLVPGFRQCYSHRKPARCNLLQCALGGASPYLACEIYSGVRRQQLEPPA